MNEGSEKLDARLRSLFGTLDAQPGFEARVAARVAALGALAAQAAPQFTLQEVEARRELERRRLAREAWSRGLSIAGLGLAAGALVWQHATDITRWAHSGALDFALEPAQLNMLSTAVLLGVLWPWIRRLPVLRDF